MLIRQAYPFEDTLMIKEIMETMSKLTDMVMNKRINYNYKYELRDCIIWCLNLLNEFVTLPSNLNLISFIIET